MRLQAINYQAVAELAKIFGPKSAAGRAYASYLDVLHNGGQPGSFGFAVQPGSESVIFLVAKRSEASSG